MSKAYTAVQAARMAGVGIQTIHRYLRDKKIEPKGIPLGDGRTLWQFSTADVEKVKKLRAESRPGRKVRAKGAEQR